MGSERPTDFIRKRFGDLLFANRLPLAQVALPEQLNFRRSDNFETIWDEAKQLAPIDSILLSTDEGVEISVDVGNTVGVAPHTFFSVTENVFLSVWKKYIQAIINTDNKDQQGFLDPNHQFFTRIDPDKAVQIPLHIITWCRIRIHDTANSEQPDRTIMFDLYDLTDRDKNSSGPEQKIRQLLKGKKDDVLGLITKRLDLSNQVLNELYNTIVLPVLNKRLQENKSNFVLPEDSADIANTLNIGSYRGMDQSVRDGLGGGPSSVTCLHFMSVVYPGFEKLSRLFTISKGSVESEEIPLNLQTEYIKLLQTLYAPDQEVISGGLVFVDPANSGELVAGKLAELITKQLDPYSYFFWEIIKKWAVNEVRLLTENLADSTVEKFTHHTNPNRPDQRFANGIKMELPLGLANSAEIKTQVISSLLPFFAKVKNVWDELKEICLDNYHEPNDLILKSKVEAIIQKYDLPPELVSVVLHLKPTDRQLAIWHENIKNQLQLAKKDEDNAGLSSLKEKLASIRQRHANILARLLERDDKSNPSQAAANFLLSQVILPEYDGSNGKNTYNIPGFPGWGLSFDERKDKLVVYLGPLLSLKATAELWWGMILWRSTDTTT